MSTRCVINFCDAPTERYARKIVAKVYRHDDGYPEGVEPDLEQFFDAVRDQTNDTRFNDPSYLAAKFVVWQANINGRGNQPLDFRGLGVILENPSDIEYEYFVDCGSVGSPKVTHQKYRG